jgi:hypothetical protein
MNASLAARFPLEMLHDVGDVHAIARDADRLQRFVEHSPGRSDERLAGNVFGVTRLLADKHHLCVIRTLAEDRLRGAAIQITSGAALCCLPGGAQRRLPRNERRRRVWRDGTRVRFRHA